MEIHAYLLIVRVHMYVRRCDVSGEAGCGEIHDTRRIDVPGTLKMIRVRHTNVVAIVMRKVQVIAAERRAQPRRRFNQRRAIDVVTHALVHMGANDGAVGESRDIHFRFCPLPTIDYGIVRRS